MTDIHAALGCSQIERLCDYIARRTALAQRYHRLLANSGLTFAVVRSGLRVGLASLRYRLERGGVRIGRAGAFASLRPSTELAFRFITFRSTCARITARLLISFRPGQYPNAEAHYARAITIPLFAALTEAQQDVVVDRLMKLAA